MKNILLGIILTIGAAASAKSVDAIYCGLREESEDFSLNVELLEVEDHPLLANNRHGYAGLELRQGNKILRTEYKVSFTESKRYELIASSKDNVFHLEANVDNFSLGLLEGRLILNGQTYPMVCKK